MLNCILLDIDPFFFYILVECFYTLTRTEELLTKTSIFRACQGQEMSKIIKISSWSAYILIWWRFKRLNITNCPFAFSPILSELKTNCDSSNQCISVHPSLVSFSISKQFNNSQWLKDCSRILCHIIMEITIMIDIICFFI